MKERKEPGKELTDGMNTSADEAKKTCLTVFRFGPKPYPNLVISGKKFSRERSGQSVSLLKHLKQGLSPQNSKLQCFLH